MKVTVSTKLYFILNFQVYFEIVKMVNYMCLSLCNEVCIRNSNAFLVVHSITKENSENGLFHSNNTCIPSLN